MLALQRIKRALSGEGKNLAGSVLSGFEAKLASLNVVRVNRSDALGVCD